MSRRHRAVKAGDHSGYPLHQPVVAHLINVIWSGQEEPRPAHCLRRVERVSEKLGKGDPVT